MHPPEGRLRSRRDPTLPGPVPGRLPVPSHLACGAVDAAQLRPFIRDIADFPQPGVVFRDITPLLGDADALRTATELLAAPFDGPVTKVIGIEARGFILAAPIAVALGAGFVPVRKAGKLPWDTHAHTYELEYGTDTLEVHRDALGAADQVLVVDDVLATGGTAAATCRLVAEYFDATVVGVTFLLELTSLGGRTRLAPLGHQLQSVLVV